MEICISKGNLKLGNIKNISLPSYTTCIGKNEFCKKICYSVKYENRYKLVKKAYLKNYKISKDNNLFIEKVINKLNKFKNKKYFRIHVAGDFYHKNYVKNWIKICDRLPNTLFWTYTRSWISDEILHELKKLNELINVQVFLSVDKTMKVPSVNLRKAFINNDKQASGIICKHDTKEKKSCEDCGYCFKCKSGNVIFKLR